MGNLTAAYAYDALGRRVRRIDYVTGGTTATTVKYYYDGQNVVAEFDGSTTPVPHGYD